MFSKIDNKILIIATTVLILAVAIGFAVYAYVIPWYSMVQNNEGGIQAPEVEIVPPAQGGLIVCVDKCGDGICQKEEDKCGNLNCVCKEDKQECPQDCK